ncbi:MAG: PHP domain-containing protein [Syntrophotaleaceae bacterium]
MTRWVDLHLHSTCSDGALRPAEMVEMAAKAGLAAVAIADHDNVDGIDEALEAGRGCGIEVLPAVELSVVWQEFTDIHLLGYCFDHRHPELCAALAEFREFRDHRNQRIVEVNRRLAVDGQAPIDFDAIRQRAGGTLGRPHIALELIHQGHVRSKDEAFERYLVPCNVAKRYFPIAEAIALIQRAGGVTSLAHPAYISRDRPVLKRLFDLFVEQGLEGLEVYSNQATNDDIDWFLGEAHRRGLMVTGGSDFHGGGQEQLVLGGLRGNLRVPYRCVEALRAAAAERQAPKPGSASRS